MAAVTRKGSSLLFSAVTDTYAAQAAFVVGVTFRGSGLTPGDIVLLQDDDGDTIADFIVEQTTQNVDLWNGRPSKYFRGLKIANAIAGTWVLSVFLE